MSGEQKLFGISVVGQDQPGIIAALSRALLDLECNLADTTMSILSGHFAMVLIAQTGPSVTKEALLRALAERTRGFDLVCSVNPVSEYPQETKSRAMDRDYIMVSVYGADRPGIVHGITSAISSTGSNIADLRTQRSNGTEGASAALYALYVQVELAADADKNGLVALLKSVADRFGVSVTVQNVAAMEL